MPSQNGNGGQSGPWGGGSKPGADLEDLVRRGQGRLKQIMPGGGPRGVIILAVLALIAWGAWSAFLKPNPRQHGFGFAGTLGLPAFSIW